MIKYDENVYEKLSPVIKIYLNLLFHSYCVI